MPYKYNPFTGNLDFYSGSGVSGPSSSTFQGIARYADTTGQVLEDSPYATVQDSGAVQAQAFIFNNAINNNVVVPANNVMLGRNVQVTSGDIILNSDAELLLL